MSKEALYVPKNSSQSSLISIINNAISNEDHTITGDKTFATPAFFSSGSASAPSITFSSDTNTGIYSSAADNVDLTTNGVNRINISNSGVKIGANGTARSMVLIGKANYAIATTDIVSGSNATKTISFGQTFPSAPNVFVSLQADLGTTIGFNECILTINSVSTTQFVVVITNKSSSTTSGAISIMWRAEL